MERSPDIKLLLLQVSEGDEAAFSILFKRYGKRVGAFAMRLTRSEVTAQETVQDVFVKIWVRRETLISVDNFDAYLFSIVRNYVYNVLRRQALELQAKSRLQQERHPTSDIAEEDINADRRNDLHRAINNLPLQQRRVLELCQIQGLKYQEAARLLNISQLTVKTHMQQALRSIRLQLGRIIISLFCVALHGVQNRCACEREAERFVLPLHYTKVFGYNSDPIF